MWRITQLYSSRCRYVSLITECFERKYAHPTREESKTFVDLNTNASSCILVWNDLRKVLAEVFVIQGRVLRTPAILEMAPQISLV